MKLVIKDLPPFDFLRGIAANLPCVGNGALSPLADGSGSERTATFFAAMQSLPKSRV
jgi:hypothetical protein